MPGFSDNQEDARTKALAVARGLLELRGFESLSTAAVAEMGGLHLATVEAEFTGPDELLIAVVQADDERVERDIRRRMADCANATDQMAVVIEGCVTESDWTYWIEVWSRALRSEAVARVRQDLDDRFRVLVEEVIVAGQKAGEFQTGDSAVLAVAIATLIDSLAMLATIADTTVSTRFMHEECSAAIGALLGATLPRGVERPEAGDE